MVMDGSMGQNAVAVVAAPAPAKLAEAAMRLLTKPPADNDAAIERRLAVIVGASVAVRVEWRYPADGSAPQQIITGIGRPRGITAQQITDVVRALELGMAPAPAETILKELARLELMIVPRKDGGDDNARRSVYADALRAYPADAAVLALRSVWKFWPAWAELQERVERLCHRRRRLLEAARTWKPWDRSDELADLERAIDAARWDARTLRDTDPDRASAAAEAWAAFEEQAAQIGAAG